MFRVNQSQTLTKSLEGLLSRFKSEDTVKTVRTSHGVPQSHTMEITLAYTKRRRRARRLAGPVATNLRSTWF